MTSQPGTLDPIDRRLLVLLATGCSAAEAAAAEGLTIVAVAGRMAAVRTHLGVGSTRAAIDVVLGSDVAGGPSPGPGP